MVYESYSPLPASCTIKQSPIHGLGLFAVNDIPKGTNLGRSHCIINGELIRLPLGGFVNHSNTPNLVLKRQKGTRFLHAVTTKDVKAGEELTGEYINV